MDKCLMLAVAGSGKTTYLISRLNLDERFLLVTYTNNNLQHLRKSILKKFGYYPENIRVLSYFQFLYSFCFKPFFALSTKSKGLTFHTPPEQTRYKPDDNSYYMLKGRMMYSNRLAKYCKKNCADAIKARLDKYYDHFFIDEVQDIAGHDFDMLMAIIPQKCNSLFVGDFYQHTFDTSHDGAINKNLYSDYNKYIARWRKAGVSIDNTSLSKTHRCSCEICDFIAQLGIAIESTGISRGSVVYVSDENKCHELVKNSIVPKLFYDNSSKYACVSMNWGASKGLDHFNDVCVVLNKNTHNLYRKGKLNELSGKTKNKLYVACTRAHQNLYIVSYEFLEKFKID